MSLAVQDTLIVINCKFSLENNEQKAQCNYFSNRKLITFLPGKLITPSFVKFQLVLQIKYNAGNAGKLLDVYFLQ